MAGTGVFVGVGGNQTTVEVAVSVARSVAVGVGETGGSGRQLLNSIASIPMANLLNSKQVFLQICRFAILLFCGLFNLEPIRKIW